mmetsp:Transcript_2546/g.9193  ORF Transcript_2546/g.9193 Transcript_2546/m.9193 type:complete len:232 (+) Transcript_2546:2993-3688(+)
MLVVVKPCCCGCCCCSGGGCCCCAQPPARRLLGEAAALPLIGRAEGLAAGPMSKLLLSRLNSDSTPSSAASQTGVLRWHRASSTTPSTFTRRICHSLDWSRLKLLPPAALEEAATSRHRYSASCRSFVMASRLRFHTSTLALETLRVHTRTKELNAMGSRSRGTSRRLPSSASSASEEASRSSSMTSSPMSATTRLWFAALGCSSKLRHSTASICRSMPDGRACRLIAGGS